VKPAQFEYHAPESLDEVVALLAELGDDAKVLAGGQSLVPLLALRLTRFDHLIDLNRVGELQWIAGDDGGVTVGAMTRQAVAERAVEVARGAPLLAKAIPFIGHFQIRNRGTVGGSIAHADSASELPAVARALDAEIEVASVRGGRLIPVSSFFVSTWETSIAPDEVVTSVRFPRWGDRSGFAVEELALRTGDFALAGIACGVELDAAGRITRAAMSFMGMGTTPTRADAAEAAAVGELAGELDLAELAALAIEATSPTDDVHASARYRRQVGAVLVRRAFGSAVMEALDE
jgi:carbon-monoxide dehydrogenase medium subunit